MKVTHSNAITQSPTVSTVKLVAKNIRYINKQNAHYHYIIIIMIIFNFSWDVKTSHAIEDALHVAKISNSTKVKSKCSLMHSSESPNSSIGNK